MRCIVATCWNKGHVDVHVIAPERTGMVRLVEKAEDEWAEVDIHNVGLCYGCYLRLVRTRRRAGHTEPWPRNPISVEEYRAAFDTWEPEPENPNDKYMAEMEATVWRNR